MNQITSQKKDLFELGFNKLDLAKYCTLLKDHTPEINSITQQISTLLQDLSTKFSRK
jgi:hypothetical protein